MLLFSCLALRKAPVGPGLSGAPAARALAPGWEELHEQVVRRPAGAKLEVEAEQRARGGGAAHIDAELRLFGTEESQLSVILYRDAAGWCPYCQKVWLLLEEKEIPYRVVKVPLNAYGYKSSAFTRKVEGGKLPAIELDGELHVESFEIMKVLDCAFDSPRHGQRMLPCESEGAEARALLALEKELQSDWFSLVFYPVEGDALESATARLLDTLRRVDEALGVMPGSWFLGADAPSIVDIMFVATIERLFASALYWKGMRIRGTGRFPRLEGWMEAFEARPAYIATKADFYSLVMAIPSQNGPGYHVDEALDIAACLEGLDGAWDEGGNPELAFETLSPLEMAGGDQEARVEAAFKLVANHEAIVEFAARGGRERVIRWRAELAEPDAEPEKAFFGPVDLCLRHVVVGLLEGSEAAAAAGAFELGGCCSSLPLAEGWDAYVDLKGRDYFYRDDNGESTYTPPTRQLDDCLAYLRDRVGVPRDMGGAAARALRAQLNWAIDLLRSDAGASK